MRKLSAAAAAVSVLAGGAGFVLRTLVRENGFEPLTGLPAPNYMPSRVFFILTVCMAAAAAVFALIVKSQANKLEDEKNENRKSRVSQLLYTFASCVFIISAISFYREYREISELNIINAAHTALCALTGISFGAAALASASAGSYKLVKRFVPLSSLVPEVFFTVWLVIMYQNNQTNPVTTSFAPRVIAITCAALALYFRAGYVFGKKSPSRFMFFNMTGIFASVSTIADASSETVRVIFAVTALILVNELLCITKYQKNVTSPD